MITFWRLVSDQSEFTVHHRGDKYPSFIVSSTIKCIILKRHFVPFYRDNNSFDYVYNKTSSLSCIDTWWILITMLWAIKVEIICIASVFNLFLAHIAILYFFFSRGIRGVDYMVASRNRRTGQLLLYSRLFGLWECWAASHSLHLVLKGTFFFVIQAPSRRVSWEAHAYNFYIQRTTCARSTFQKWY